MSRLIRPRAREQRFQYYTLPQLLPEGHVLVLHLDLGLLSELAPGESERAKANGNGHPLLVAQAQLTLSKRRTLTPLLDNYPDYCPYEYLHASFWRDRTDEQAIEQARQRLQEAHFAEVWDYELRPLRNFISRTRFKLRDFGIDIRSLLETGWLLVPMKPQGREHEDGEK